jgi:large subunit ribosomal protein L9
LRLEKSLAAKDGRAFGSLRKEDIIEFLHTHGIFVSKDAVALDQPIKKAGEYAVPISLHPEVSATLTIAVLLSPQS